MYKLIMVDDELETHNRLQNIVDYNSYGFEISGCFENGLDALEFIESNEDIDLVITDIKMPFMDGLQLTKAMKEKHPLIKAIIITGFDEFDYAKKALENGVIGYIMKPITKEELINVLKETNKVLNNEKQLFHNLEELEEHKKKSQELLQASILDLLIKEPLNDYILSTLNFLNIDIKSNYYQVITLAIEGNYTFEEIDYHLLALDKIVENCELSHISFRHKEKYVIILKLESDMAFKQKIDAMVNDIIFRMNKFDNCKIIAGISTISYGIDSIRDLYYQSNHALSYINTIKDTKILYFDNISESSAQYSAKEDFFKQLRYSIRYGTYDEAIHELKRTFQKIPTICNPRTNNLIILELASSLMKSVENINKLFEIYKNDIYDILKEKISFDEVMNKACEIIYNIQIINKNCITNKFELSINKALQFMETNYSNPSLNLDMLSEKMKLSVSYLCALFKKEKNETFVKILTDIRMNKAIELLKNSNMKIVEIAEAVGYIEPYYFSHSFKKHTGYSPKSYKEQWKKEK